MTLIQQILSLCYHLWMGICFAFVFSFISLLLNYFKRYIRILMMVLFGFLFTLVFYYGLYKLNYGVSHLYGMMSFIVGCLLYYEVAYSYALKLFIPILAFLKRIRNWGRVVKNKIYDIIIKAKGKKKGGRRVDQSDTKKKRRTRKHLNRAKNLILLVCSCGFIYTVVSELLTTQEIQQNLAAAQIVAQEIQEENEYLEEQKTRLQNPEYVSRYARGKLLVSEDGEQVFSLDTEE